MGWDRVGKGSGESLPIVKIEGKPVRLRLVAGPGKLAEPEQRWQHWPEGEAAKAIKAPIACAGARDGCIFHQEPLKWRLSKQNLMNAVVYDCEVKVGAAPVIKGKKIEIFAQNTVYETIAQQCALMGVADPTSMDIIVSKSGVGKQTTYTVTMVPPLEPQGIDLTQYPAQPADFQADGVPQLIDYDKFEGFKKRSADEQMAWYDDKITSGAGDPPADAAGATAGVAAPPPAPAAAYAPPAPVAAATPPKITMPKATPAPAAPAAAAPPPPPAAVAPPPAPGPDPAQVAREAATATIEAWNAGSSTNADHLKYVCTTDGFTEEQKDAAALLLALQFAKNEIAAPVEAAVAAVGDDLEAMRNRIKDEIKNNPLFKTFTNTRKFLGLTGKNAVNALEHGDLQLLVGHIDAGTVAQAIQQAA